MLSVEEALALGAGEILLRGAYSVVDSRALTSQPAPAASNPLGNASLGLIGAFTGVGGLCGGQRSTATASVGLILSLLGKCLFLGVLSAIQRGAAP